MAFPTSVNDVVIDAVASTNVEVVSLSPAMSMGEFYGSTAQALSLAAHNATNAQQQGYVTSQAATVVGVAKLLGVPIRDLQPPVSTSGYAA
jgi:hypothetical protein